MSTCCHAQANGQGHSTDCPKYGAEVQRLKLLENMASTYQPSHKSKHHEARVQRARAKARKRRK